MKSILYSILIVLLLISLSGAATFPPSFGGDIPASVSSTELGYLDGVTSAIQTQLNAKAGYPGAGIPISTGSAWGSSITDSHTNWDTAYTNRITTCNAPLSCAANAISLSTSGTWSGNATTATTTTNLAGGNGTTLLGSMPYQSNTNTTTLLSPNVTTTKKFLTQTGDGTYGAVPAWNILAVGDLPTGSSLQSVMIADTCPAGTGTINFSTGPYHQLTLTVNCTSLTLTDPSATLSTPLYIQIKQGGAGSYTVTLPAEATWVGGAPVLLTGVGDIDHVVCRFDPNGSPYQYYCWDASYVDATNATSASTNTFTNKTFDVSGTGNVFKMTNYIVLTHPHLCTAGAPVQTTSTTNTYGQCKFGNATDKATNYAEYYLTVPGDIDTAVDLTGTFKIQLSDADTGDHEYEISFDSVANSAAYAGSLGDAVSLAYTADASGASGDVETAGPTTLTGWKSALTAGQLMVVRVARDGDHANDGSTVDSYSGPLVVSYGVLQ